jgi:hypothetical protein
LTRTSRAALKRSPSVIIIKTPNKAWTEIMEAAVLRRHAGAVVMEVSDRAKQGRNLVRKGAEPLRALRMSKTVVYVSPDPDTLLDEAVLAAADETIVIPQLTAVLLTKAIRRVTGGTPRGITADMAALDLSTIQAVVRPGLSARQCVDNMRRALRRQAVAPAQALASPLLSELPLTAPVRSWTDQLLAELAAVKNGSLPAKELVFGVLEARQAAARLCWRKASPTRLDGNLSVVRSAVGSAPEMVASAT